MSLFPAFTSSLPESIPPPPSPALFPRPGFPCPYSMLPPPLPFWRWMATSGGAQPPSFPAFSLQVQRREGELSTENFSTIKWARRKLREAEKLRNAQMQQNANNSIDYDDGLTDKSRRARRRRFESMTERNWDRYSLGEQAYMQENWDGLGFYE